MQGAPGLLRGDAVMVCMQPAPIRRPQNPIEEAEFWKNKGNDYFTFRDFLKAKDCYSKSLQFLQTVAAYANRALVCIKLKEWKLAEGDCSAVSFQRTHLWSRVASGY